MFALSPDYINISDSFKADGAIRIGSALSENKRANTTLVESQHARTHHFTLSMR